MRAVKAILVLASLVLGLLCAEVAYRIWLGLKLEILARPPAYV
jgi:hypothetical protein